MTTTLPFSAVFLAAVSCKFTFLVKNSQFKNFNEFCEHLMLIVF